MGATGWSHFTEWQPDSEAALRKLQQEVFDRGEYIFEPGESPDFPENWLEGEEPPLSEGSDLPPDWKPASIVELLQHVGPSGTSSILDIFGISQEQDFAMASPLAQTILRKAFGTARPTRTMVEEKEFELDEYISRGSAIFFPVWETGSPEGKPKWWYFNGATGD